MPRLWHTPATTRHASGQELGTTPDQSITSLAAELRHAPADGDRSALGRRRMAARSRRRVVPTRVWKAAVIGLTLMDLMVLTALWLSRRHPPHPPMDPNLVAVFPFTVEGDSEVQYLGSGMVDLLTSNLEGAGATRGGGPARAPRLAGEAESAAYSHAGPRDGRSIRRRASRPGERAGERWPAARARGRVRPRAG